MAQTKLTSAQAADRLGVSIKTLQRWVRDGLIRGYALPSGRLRFDPDDIDGALQEVA